LLVELTKDARTLLLPTTRADVEDAIRSLRTFALLDGFRGRPKAALLYVVDAGMAIAEDAAANRETLSELDVNTLMVQADAAAAVDPLIVEAV
jgi:hypothetical protein